MMIRKIGHIMLTFALLLSTMNMTINLHYCQKGLYDVAFYKAADNCCMQQNFSQNGKNQHYCMVGHHHKCGCKDETIQIGSVDDFLGSSFDVDFNNIPSSVFLNVYNSLISELYIAIYTLKIDVPKWDISPPKIQTVLALLQTYLL